MIANFRSPTMALVTRPRGRRFRHPHDPRTRTLSDEDFIDTINDARGFLAIAEVAAKKATGKKAVMRCRRRQIASGTDRGINGQPSSASGHQAGRFIRLRLQVGRIHILKLPNIVRIARRSWHRNPRRNRCSTKPKSTDPGSRRRRGRRPGRQAYDPENDFNPGRDDPTMPRQNALAFVLLVKYCREVTPKYEFFAVEMETKPLDIDCGGGVIVQLTGTMDRARVCRKSDGPGIADVKRAAAAVQKGGKNSRTRPAALAHTKFSSSTRPASA